MQINQFHSGNAVGDAITNQMFLIRDILRKNGVIPIEDIDLDADMLAILHNRGMHSVGDVLAKLDGITKMF